MADSASPYLSVVVTSRNDDHGGNLKKRMQAFVDGWFHLAKRHGLSSELIIVEWNPPPEKARLAEALRWPEDKGPCRVRIIEVPNTIHQTFDHASKLPLFQFTAKNVGIRRAWGKFVLATNIDILFSDQMIAYLARQQLDEGVLYRNDRLDVPTDLPEDVPFDDVLAFCRRNIIRINGNRYTLSFEPMAFLGHHLTATDSFMVGVMETIKTFSAVAARSGEIIPSMARLIVQPGPIPAKHRLRLLRKLLAVPASAMGETWKKWKEMGEKSSIHRSKTGMIHTNACGDFQLMALDKWMGIQGYPEYEGYSIHLDSLLSFAAIYGDWAREETLLAPMHHYHIEHGVGSGFTPEGEKALYERLDKAGIPYLNWFDVLKIAFGMADSGKVVQFNDSGWGLAGAYLPETILD